jgi:hypothetical protein
VAAGAVASAARTAKRSDAFWERRRVGVGAIATVGRPLARDVPNHEAAFRGEVTAATFDEQIDMLIDALRELAERFNRGDGRMSRRHLVAA